VITISCFWIIFTSRIQPKYNLPLPSYFNHITKWKNIMKQTALFLILAGAILLVVMAAPVTASSTTISGDSITSISPSVGYRSDTTTVTITGNNFTTTKGSVRLEMSGETDLDATISSWSDSKIVCKVKITSSKETGYWDVVVVKGDDDTEIVKTEGFTITDEMILTSITPASALADNDNVDFTLTGTHLSDVQDVYLYKKGYDNTSANNFDVSSSTKIKGTFDLTDADDASYYICVEDSLGTTKCGLSFKVIPNEVGGITISSNPSGASISIDGIANGTTPATVDNLIAGSHKVVLTKSGYLDWGKIVTVEADDTVTVDSDLTAITTSAEPSPVPTPEIIRTPAPTPVWTSEPPTERPTRESPVAVPTTLPATATTKASPVDPAVILGALGLGVGIAVLRKP
jgi:hypothetical protein